MENFDRENIDELLEIRQIRQYFPPSKFCAVRYVCMYILINLHLVVSQSWHNKILDPLAPFHKLDKTRPSEALD